VLASSATVLMQPFTELTRQSKADWPGH